MTWITTLLIECYSPQGEGQPWCLRMMERNSSTFAILSVMAKDLLTPPMSSVAIDLKFSGLGRLISKYQTRLASEAIEAFTCLDDWHHQRRMISATSPIRRRCWGFYFLFNYWWWFRIISLYFYIVCDCICENCNFWICELKLHIIVCRFVGANLIRIYLYYYDVILSIFFIFLINEVYLFELFTALFFYLY